MSLSTAARRATVQRIVVELLPPGSDATTIIFGAGGVLDSLGLVNLLADLEYRLAQEFGRDLVLASERAMSRVRSPFRDVSSLSGYVVELLEVP